jgi:hypothetical protein
MVNVSLRKDSRGVSVVVGALMLILIVVTAASALALFVSQMQKEEMEQQSHIAAVEGEELELSYIALEKNSTYWSSMNLTILNLNVKDTYVTAISVNENYATNYTANGEIFNRTSRLLIPAARSEEVHLNFTSNFTTPLNISEEEPITITVVTSLANDFERTFKPPAPIVKTKIEMEDLSVADRAVLVLDGSDSFDDGGAITEWKWELWDASYTTPEPGNWSDTGNLTKRDPPAEGKIVRMVFNSSGPFKVRLTVKDDTGMEGTSENITIPANPSFNPATNLNAEKSGNQIEATVKDIEGKPVNGAVVNFMVFYDRYGNLTVDPWSDPTDESGIATANVTGGNGTIRVVSGKLAYVDIAVP